MSSAAMPTIGHSPLIALGILGAAAYLEAVLVLHFRGSERALLATVQRENAENRQRSPLHRSHPDLPPVTAYGPKIARDHFPSHRDRRRHTSVSQVCHIQVSNSVDKVSARNLSLRVTGFGRVSRCEQIAEYGHQ